MDEEHEGHGVEDLVSLLTESEQDEAEQDVMLYILMPNPPSSKS